VLVTGAAGFIGSHVRAALGSKYRFWCIDRKPAGDLGESDVSDVVDLGCSSSLERIWSTRPEITGKLHAVINLAAYYDFRNEPNPEYSRINEGLEGLLGLLSRDAPAECVFVHAGSMATLAPVDPGQFQTEKTPRAGLWEYPRSKIRAEQILDASAMQQPVVQLILAAVYSDWCELVPLYEWIELCAGRGPEKYFYPGPSGRGLTYCHVDDVVLAFDLALQKFAGDGEYGKSSGKSSSKPVREKFLVGQGDPLNYQEIHERACTAFAGKATKLMRVPREVATIGAHMTQLLGRLRGADSFIRPWMVAFAGEHFHFDLSHVRELLGWEPRRSVHQDLEVMLKHAVKDREQWIKVNALRPR
jgi:nucleoside-diphosphate-sugar epimerase